jgi:hypothetical protein
MRSFRRVLYSRKSWLTFSVLALMLFLGVSLSTNPASANHPVLVEGNCDSPVPGTTIVQPGTCGDFDGDGRIGTAEDTDGADRIFGTIRAALGPGTGAATGTGANHNGTITIVRSGRFNENIVIGNTGYVFNEGIATPGNVTIEAAPGVEANINAVKQGDPTGNNDTRQLSTGIQIVYDIPDRRVVLRNLTISNFATGIRVNLISRVTIDNCRLENNLNYGILVGENARAGIFRTRVASTGFRVGTIASPPNPGTGIVFEGFSSGSVAHSQVTGSFGAGLNNTGTGTVTYYELFLGHNGAGPIINAVRNNTP